MKNQREDVKKRMSPQRFHLHKMYNLSHEVQIMGILNLTPDSFYQETNTSLKERLSNLSQSDIIDVGAESSKPGAIPVSSNEEIKRLEPLLPLLNKSMASKLSIDTYKPKTAHFALKRGFDIVNDIKGGESIEMLEVVAQHDAKIILMHMQGSPRTMQDKPFYEDIINDIQYFFDERCNKAIEVGVKPDNIIIDPGIGFGKTISDNDRIISSIPKFKKMGFPVLIGLSRKSFLQHDGDFPSHRLAATISMNTLSILNGANIIRVHDVEEHIKTRALISRMSTQYSGELNGC
jgi:dihydropteroate synthase